MGKKIKSRKIVKYYYYEEEEPDKKKIRYLFILLLFTAVLLSTTTYAWFTTNRVVSINSLNVKIQAEGSLEISVDGTDWKAVIDTDAITSAHSGNYGGSTNQLPTYVEPVSTGGNLSGNGFMQMYLGTVMSDADGNYILTSSSSVETESNGDNSDGKFVAFDIFLRTTESKTIYLTNESKITYNGTSSPGTENAMRAAFIVEGNTSTGSALGTVQSLTTNDRNNVYIWEPNYDTHSATGISNARDVYNITTSAIGAAQLSYDGVIGEVSQGNAIGLGNAKASNYPTLFSTVIPKISTTNGFSNYQEMFNLQAGITKVRVYFWLEGQDVDCENNASVGDINFNIQFSTNPS